MTTTEEVINLVKQLYGSGSNKNIKIEADKQLQNFQASPDAWKISLDILRQSNISVESYYFAANTLRTKIQNNYRELPSDYWQPLRDSLIDVIMSSGDKEFSKSTCSQISVAIAHLALQSEQWSHCLLYLRNLVNKHNSTINNALTILQILQYIPEDIDSKRLELGENRRNTLRNEFSEDAEKCIDLLSGLKNVDCDEKQKNDILLRLFKCLSSWLRAEIIHPNSIDKESFVNLAFNLLTQNNSQCSIEFQLHEVVTDFICSVINSCYNQASTNEFLSKIYNGVVQLRESYLLSIATEDSDKSQNFVTIFSATAEIFIDSILKINSTSIGDDNVILDILLDCCGHYDFEIALHTFNFWFTFADLICKQNDQTYTTHFSPYFERLIVSLFRLCQLEPDRTELLQMKDDFFEFRNLARDLIMESVAILHPMKIISHSKSILDDQTSPWERSEAAIFVLTAVAKFIHREENQVTPQLFQKVLHIAQHHNSSSPQLCLDYVVLQFIGELGTWVNNHPEFMESLIQFLVTRLSVKELNDGASNALLNICVSNADQLAPHFDTLCQLLNHFDLQKQKSSDDLIQALASILSRKEDAELKEGLNKLVKYCIESAANSAAAMAKKDKTNQGNKGDATSTTATSPSGSGKESEGRSSDEDDAMRCFVPVLDRLSILFQYVKPNREIPHGASVTVEHPCKDAIGQVLPIILNVVNHYKSSEKIAEKGCRTLRYCIRSLGLHFDDYLAHLVQNVVDLYSFNGFSCFLYLGGIIVDEFGTTQQYVVGLSALFDQFSVKALHQFAEADGFRNHPDTVDDFYRLVLRITQKCPNILIQSDKFEPVFQAAIYAQHLDHKEALISVVEFLDCLFSTGKNNQHLRLKLSHTLASHGNHLLTEALSSSVFSLPRYLLPDISIVFQTVSQFDNDSYCLFLAHAFQSLATREETATKNVSEQQLANIYNAIVSDSNYRIVSRNLKALVRLYR